MADDQKNNTAEIKLLTNGFNHQSVPQSYIQPLEKRPTNLLSLPSSYNHQNTPIIDLGGESDDGFDRAKTIQQIFKAIDEFGVFQVINHGISEEMMEEVMSLGKEFFEMPFEDRSKLYCDSRQTPVRLASSIMYDTEEVHYWRDSLRHACHPVEEVIHSWPSKPTKYREVVAAYSVKVRALVLKLLELIAEGLGLKSNYFDGDVTQMQSMVVNHYPPCPDPSLTLGLPMHIDPNVITLLTQDVLGLQVLLKDGEWMYIEPLPHAFVVFLGHQLQIISNDKLRGVEHRVLTNTTTARTTITTQINCTMDYHIGPAKELIDESNPARYRSFKYQEFFESYLAASLETEKTVKHFKLQA